jgi:hypothetical protein
MASIKSEKTLDDAEKAVQTRQTGPAPFNQEECQTPPNKCKYFLPAFIFSSFKNIKSIIPVEINRNIFIFNVKNNSNLSFRSISSSSSI